ncbi:hypothetical protein [Lactobacillus sp. PV034]|uniref:hypothetical protein n=1 Tax=Lactobacillus sp. PV034 TaxID=2594495 RepID=UPI00223EFF69|nr:hypothetical protein [Lactobacillus sp. PV034]QNQ80355.1 hypothetical protein FP432_01695 [Lactobacillus sp. PV034]
MKTKNVSSLVLTNGIVGLVGGIFLLFGTIFTTAFYGVLAYWAGGEYSEISGSDAIWLVIIGVIFIIIKIAILVLGIVGAVKFKNVTQVHTAPTVLLIVGGAVAMIPFCDTIGGIIAIVGGSLYLAALKRLDK